MKRSPSNQTIENVPGGNLVAENIEIEDIGNTGATITWDSPNNGNGGGIASFTISAFHVELLDETETIVLARIPELPEQKAAIYSATFLDYPNNPNHAGYNPQSPPNNKVRIVSYMNTGTAHSSIIIEDIVMKDEPGGINGLAGRKLKRRID